MPASESEAYNQSVLLLLGTWEHDPEVNWTIDHIDGDLSVPGVPIQFPNKVDAIVRDRESATGNNIKPWAQMLWQPATGRQTNVGSNSGANRFEHRGTLTLQINVPAGEGLFLATALATMAGKAFKGKSTAGGVFYKNPRTQNIGKIQGGFVYRVDFLTEFQFDEVT
jgi:hypothetical protein